MAQLDQLVDARASNAAISWGLLAVLVVSLIQSLVEGNALWAIFGMVVIVVALVPAVIAKSSAVMVSWEVLLPSALPALSRLADAFVSPLGYLSVAALSLLVVAEIDQFTSTRMSGWLAATFVVMTTMSIASIWTIVQYFADRWIGIAFATSVDALMWELIVASSVGVAFGVLFELVLRGREAG